MLIVPESSISILNFLPQYKAENTISESLSTIPSIEKMKTPSNSIEEIMNVNNTKNPKSINKPINLSNNNTTHIKKKNIIINILTLIWITGLLIILIGTIILQIYFTHKLKLCKKIDDSDLLIIIGKCKRTLGIKRNINIYIGNSFKSPFIIGLLKPSIYISEQLINLDQAHFEHVILHELAHYKRKDILYNIFSILAMCIHWFNPIIWKITSIIKSDIDLACDTYVLNKLGENKAKSYGNSILAVTRLSLSERNQIGLACYFSNKKQLERRIIMINKYKNNTYKFTAIYLVAALLISCVVLTNPINAQQKHIHIKTSLDNLEISSNSSKDMIERLLVGERDCCDNINSFIDAIQFDFLLPSYIPKNYQLDRLSWSPKNNKATLNFVNGGKHKQYHYFDIIITKKHPGNSLNYNESTSNLYPHTIDDLNGEILITNNNSISTKYFIYKKNDVYYTIKYLKKNKYYTDSLPESEVSKIIKSFKEPESINKSIYDINTNFSVYDMEDMKRARDFCNLNFKLPLDSKYKEISVDESTLRFHFANDVVLLQLNEPITSFYEYTQFDEHGIIEIHDCNKNIIEKTDGNWEFIDSSQVLKVINTYTLLRDQKQPQKSIRYYWTENNITYILSSFTYDSKIDYEDIIKSIMNAKSFDEIIK
jgi:bla regulator protein BlaR1